MKEIRVVRRGDGEYPRRLQEIPGPPGELYIMGDLPGEERASVAVIGARDCSEYGRHVADRLGRILGKNGIQVISGMARGIDGIAQQAAVEAGGSSFAVLGSGVDICYPAQNRRLYEKLKTAGGLLSEYPPGTPVRAWHFPPRNRIVSGLSDAVIVVEARERSGTLITVDMALEQGKEVYAVPGRLTDGLSAGCNRLLKLGAGILLDPGEFLEELGEIAAKRGILLSAGASGEKEKVPRDALPQTAYRLLTEEPHLRQLYDALDFLPRSSEQIKERLSGEWGEGQTAAGLMRLCMERLAVQVSPGRFCLRGEE